MNSSTTTAGSLSRRLFQEWRWICSRPEFLDHARCWPLDDAPVISLDDLLQRCGYGGRRDDNAADRLLARLLCIAPTDTVATRVVLQRVLPGMMAVVRRRGRRPADGADALLAELVGAMWLQIRTWPVERPGRHVAARLLRNAEYEAFRRSQRRVHHQREIPSGAVLPDQQLATDPTATWLDDPRRRLGELLVHGRSAGLPRGDLELLGRLASGDSVDTVADQLGISDRALRARRATAVARLREVVQAA